MTRPFVLLLGGRHKGEPYTRLAPLLAGRCRAVIAYGEAGPIVVARSVGARARRWCAAGSFDAVMARARELARPGRRGAAVSRLLELRHVHQLRGAGPALPRDRGVVVTSRRRVQHPGDLRWETRLLVVVTAVLTVFGIASLHAAATLERDAFGFFMKQLAGALAGAIALIIVSRVDYHVWRRLAWPLLLGTILLLLIPLLPFPDSIRPYRNGARRWVQIGPLNLQPSEVARFAIVVWTAMLAAKKGEAVRGFKKGLLPVPADHRLVSLLILLEPNLSMAVLVALIGGVVLFTAGAKIGHFLLLGVAGLFAGVSLIWAEPYRLTRLKCFLEPCGAGGLPAESGAHRLRLGRAARRRLRARPAQDAYLPYGYSDFLAATIGEEWGFLGVLVIAHRCSPSSAGSASGSPRPRPIPSASTWRRA